MTTSIQLNSIKQKQPQKQRLMTTTKTTTTNEQQLMNKDAKKWLDVMITNTFLPNTNDR